MLKHLTISEARREINKLASQIKSDTTISVTSRGKEVLAILPWEVYESITETLEILSDPEMMEQLRQSIKEINEGKGIPWKEVENKLDAV